MFVICINDDTKIGGKVDRKGGIGGSGDDQIEESCTGILRTQKSISHMQFNVIRNTRYLGRGKNKIRCTR